MRQAFMVQGAARPAGPYSHAVVANGFVFVSGQGPADPATGRVPDGFAAQVEQTLRNVQTILEGAGASLRDVVRDWRLPVRPDPVCRIQRGVQAVLPGEPASPHHCRLPAPGHPGRDRLHRGSAGGLRHAHRGPGYAGAGDRPGPGRAQSGEDAGLRRPTRAAPASAYQDAQAAAVRTSANGHRGLRHHLPEAGRGGGDGRCRAGRHPHLLPADRRGQGAAAGGAGPAGRQPARGGRQ